MAHKQATSPLSVVTYLSTTDSVIKKHWYDVLSALGIMHSIKINKATINNTTDQSVGPLSERLSSRKTQLCTEPGKWASVDSSGHSVLICNQNDSRDGIKLNKRLSRPSFLSSSNISSWIYRSDKTRGWQMSLRSILLLRLGSWKVALKLHGECSQLIADQRWHGVTSPHSLGDTLTFTFLLCSWILYHPATLWSFFTVVTGSAQVQRNKWIYCQQRLFLRRNLSSGSHSFNEGRAFPPDSHLAPACKRREEPISSNSGSNRRVLSVCAFMSWQLIMTTWHHDNFRLARISLWITQWILDSHSEATSFTRVV